MFKNHSLNAVGRRRLQLRRQSNAPLPPRPCRKSPSRSCSALDSPPASTTHQNSSTLIRPTTTQSQSLGTCVVQLTSSQARSNLISKRQKQLKQLQMYHSGPGLEELTSYCSPPSTSSALRANTNLSKSLDLSRSQVNSMTRETSTFSECFGDALQVPAEHRQQKTGEDHEESDSDDPSAQEGFSQQAQDTRRHDYSRPLSDFEPGPIEVRHDTPPTSPFPGSVKQDQQRGTKDHGPPASRSWKEQRGNDRTAVKEYVNGAVTKSQSKFMSWTNEQRWSFIQCKRREKLADREKKGNGTVSSWYPQQFADAGGEQHELVLFRKQMAAHFTSENVLTSRRERSPDQDEDDEEMIIKKEEPDEETSRSVRESNHQFDLGLIAQRDTTTGSLTRSHRPRDRGSDQEPVSLCSRCQRLPAVPHENDPAGEDKLRADDVDLNQTVSIGTVTSSSMTVPSVVGPEWRQYWETNQDGYSALITPRTWKWNDKCQLVEWPPLDQILPPLEPRPVLHVKQEKKRKRVDSVATPRGEDSGKTQAISTSPAQKIVVGYSQQPILTMTAAARRQRKAMLQDEAYARQLGPSPRGWP